MNFIRKLLNGRPMELVEENYFRDVVSGKMVHIYKVKNEHYMATNKWGWFRIKCPFYFECLKDKNVNSN